MERTEVIAGLKQHEDGLKRARRRSPFFLYFFFFFFFFFFYLFGFNGARQGREQI